MRIASARRLQGTSSVPGDKSISHRAALISSLADGISTIENFSTAADCSATLSCLSELGVPVEKDGTTVRIDGKKLHPPSGPLNCGNSGSTMRMMAGLLAAEDFECTLTGDASLSARPMSRIVEPLELMGATFRTDNGRPPLTLHGSNRLTAVNYQLPMPSAQVKTALLLAGIRAEGRTVIRETVRTRDHTERMLKWFGAAVETEDDSGSSVTAISGPTRLRATKLKIPGDFSSAAYFIAAAVMLVGSKIELGNVGLNPTRTQVIDLLRSVGADIETTDVREECNEPVGTIRVRGRTFQHGPSHVIEGQSTANLIDELPLLGVVGTQVPGGLTVKDAVELRVKETDRITATVKNLRAMGATVEEFADGFFVDGPVRLVGATIQTYGDHRIAMAFSVAALLANGESEITDSASVAVSFPDFFARLESLVER
ncbi:MAG TPA: 3-phosphoshikimate 1-carboxyvinyltransferase [Pyrinomonadaceae bacterium]|nr:3-phosphoshikimate 1-carboxyvinyltransferase [Pyrinomonadaceae bacterium]